MQNLMILQIQQIQQNQSSVIFQIRLPILAAL